MGFLAPREFKVRRRTYIQQVSEDIADKARKGAWIWVLGLPQISCDLGLITWHACACFLDCKTVIIKRLPHRAVTRVKLGSTWPTPLCFECRMHSINRLPFNILPLLCKVLWYFWSWKELDIPHFFKTPVCPQNPQMYNSVPQLLPW